MAEAAVCWICGRTLGVRIEWHHPCPKSRGGKETVPVHPICHKTVHATFTNAQLAAIGDDRHALQHHPLLARFLTWIATKPADFHAPTRRKM